MFGKKDTVRITTMLGQGSDFQGSLSAEGSARVDGNVDGNVKVTGTLIVGSTGRISGNVEAEAAVIGGEVLGDVIAPEKAELTATAKVLGDVSTKVIVIDEHAVFQGRCNMYQKEQPAEIPVIPKAVKPSDRPVKRTAKEALQEALREVREEERRQSEAEEENDKKGVTA